MIAQLNHILGTYQTLSGSSIVTTPVTGYDWLPDPLAHLVPPSLPRPTPCNTSEIKYTSNMSFTPGVYCNRLFFDGGTHTFASGVYVFLSGVEVNSNARVNVGDNSLLCFTCPTYPADCTGPPGGSKPALWVNSNGLLKMGAGHSDYEKVGIWVDRTSKTSNPTCSASGGSAPGTLVFNSNSSEEIGGADIIYAVKSTVELDSNSLATLLIIADTVCMDSNAVIDVDFTLVTPNAVTGLELIE